MSREIINNNLLREEWTGKRQVSLQEMDLAFRWHNKLHRARVSIRAETSPAHPTTKIAPTCRNFIISNSRTRHDNLGTVCCCLWLSERNSAAAVQYGSILSSKTKRTRSWGWENSTTRKSSSIWSSSAATTCSSKAVSVGTAAPRYQPSRRSS